MGRSSEVGNTRFRARRIEKTYLELARDAGSAAPADAADLQAIGKIHRYAPG